MLPRMLSLLLVSTALFCQNTTSSSAGQIRSMRQEIDKSFQHHDAKQLVALVSADCRFTAPTVHLDGSEALERFQESLFTRRPDVRRRNRANGLNAGQKK